MSERRDPEEFRRRLLASAEDDEEREWLAAWVDAGRLSDPRRYLIDEEDVLQAIVRAEESEQAG